MLAVLGQMKEVVLPEDEAIDKKVEEIFDFHKDRLIKVPFDLESAKSSFDKIIKKLPPNTDKNQQFKDGVIWANCLKLAEKGHVHLVTHDKAFYKNREYSKGLAPNLEDEASPLPYSITIFSELSLLLEEVKPDSDLDEQQLIELMESNTYAKILNLCSRHDFEVIGKASCDFTLYATTNPLEVSVKSSIKYNLKDELDNSQRTNGLAESKAEFILDIENYNIRDFMNLGEHISWIDKDGEFMQNQTIYGYMNAILGHKTIEHQVSYKLE